MSDREARIYNALPAWLRPLVLIAGDAIYMLTLGTRWGLDRVLGPDDDTPYESRTAPTWKEGGRGAT